MRMFRCWVAATALLSALLLLAPAAYAQEWADPTGEIRIDFASQGWRVRDRLTQPEFYREGVVAAAAPVGQEAGPMCELDYRGQGNLARPPRAHMNEIMDRMAAGDVVARMRAEGAAERVEVNDVGAVSTLDISGRFMSLETIQRRFFLWHAADQSLRMYSLVCSVDAADAEGVAQMRAVAASLHFVGVGD